MPRCRVRPDEAHSRIDYDGGGKLASAQHVVADGEFHVAVELVDALVHTFVASAEKHRAIEGREVAGDGLRERAALCREQDDAGSCGVRIAARASRVARPSEASASASGSAFSTMPSPPPKGRSSTVR